MCSKTVISLQKKKLSKSLRNRATVNRNKAQIWVGKWQKESTKFYKIYEKVPSKSSKTCNISKEILLSIYQTGKVLYCVYYFYFEDNTQHMTDCR